ncbi:Vms1/Ankzf1 family peptidyl-tRNA hydrolase [Salarchaeum sp. JOR-1]|uniref:Vms1/Ankzf1 family peptidyl-tRNA hydrolase n=1 Tax=Salarchaeum sp. JOR-1 TaxID=2599399 RepID=UPI001198AB7C|nr:Vms1/Ankzf1 family peptidyl-tRNA hydrolase [Salarchaeum sp. JOR-1]QDX40002.1 single-stranded DNA-binding protein [Salarchaeum sp. JOR-1]
MEQRLDRGERIETVREASVDDDRLVSVAVPPGELGEHVERVEEARAEAEYLDGPASEPLREALDHAVDALHEAEAGGDGLLVYTGVLGGDLRTFIFTNPPGGVTDGVFEHGNAFVTDPLGSRTTDEPTIGLVVVERGGAAIGRLDDGVESLEALDSEVPGKTRAGGQSADRFRRRREERKREFFEEVADAAERAFDDSDAVVLGGTHVTVEAFRDGDYLPAWLDDRVAGTYAVEHAGERGLEQLAAKARGDVTDGHADARDALDAFFDRLPDGDVVYGAESVDDALTYEAVDRLLVSETVDAAEREAYAERAEDEGGGMVVVPTDIEGGERFADAFGGVGALLRFPVE